MNDNRQQANAQINPSPMRHHCHTTRPTMSQQHRRRWVVTAVFGIFTVLLSSSSNHYSLAFTPHARRALVLSQPPQQQLEFVVGRQHHPNHSTSRLSRMAASTMVIPDGSSTIISDGDGDLLDGGLSSLTVGGDTETAKLGVLLLNLGGPEKSEDVEGMYLCQIPSYCVYILFVHVH